MFAERKDNRATIQGVDGRYFGFNVGSHVRVWNNGINLCEKSQSLQVASSVNCKLCKLKVLSHSGMLD